jgi:hypothetical protein
MDEFRRLNPHYEIRLHTDAERPQDERLAELFDQTDLHLSTRSDLLRYDILYREGGWYFDVDYWPLRPLDDAERAFCLDGRRVFASRMNNPRINNGMLACGPGAPGLGRVIDLCLVGGVRHGASMRTLYGPPVWTEAAKAHPNEYTIAAWPWFHGVPDSVAAAVRGRCIRLGPGCVRNMLPETAGQIPFAFHLWAHTHAASLERVSNEKPLVVICGKSNPREDASDRPYASTATAFGELGYRTAIVPWQDDAIDAVGDIPDVLVCWNGIRAHHARNPNKALLHGAKVFYLEHGFYDRNRHFQCDHKGILHRASWAGKVSEPAPPEAHKRLALWAPRIEPQRLNRGGYILVLGQVAGDSQLEDSELPGPTPLTKAVARAMAGLPVACVKPKAYFRPHPQAQAAAARSVLPILPSAGDETEGYRSTKHGNGLAEALAGARFIVTINSNAIVEALIAGVPVLAFGPSIAITAGAVKQTTLATLSADLLSMIDGWRAPDEAVSNYLAHLAAHQWSVEEFGHVDVWKALIEASNEEGAEKC